MPGELRKRELIDGFFVVSYAIDDSHDGVRADRFLKEQYFRKSRAELQRAIDAGRVVIEGKRLKSSTTLRAGDVLKVFTPRNISEPEVDAAYKVLYEDDDLLVVDKPGNLPVHPAGRFLFNTLVMALRRDRADWVAPEEERDFYLVHRLDRETSGAIVVGKRKAITADLIRQFFERETEKRYYAVAAGEILDDAFSVHNDIGPARGSAVRLKMQTYPEGTWEREPESGIQSALTHFKVLSRVRKAPTTAPAPRTTITTLPRFPVAPLPRSADGTSVPPHARRSLTLLDCQLESGRQHQIRVHLAHYGHPVVGDKLYGGREDLFLKYIEGGVFTDEMRGAFGFERHALHSRYLRFRHPRSGRWIETESALPEDMAGLLT
ncbi:MAG: RluA family pseudouridine synthase [Deltaproteobacteria bacterium]|nr:RluA family pseudouridine synthase [Deltaproteobacteria bacterium]